MNNQEKSNLTEGVMKAGAQTSASTGRVAEVVIREGQALTLERDLNVVLSGIIDSPKRYLTQRIALIDQKTSYIIVNRENMTIKLTVDEHSPVLNSVDGKLETHPIFERFGINAGNYETTHELADLIKMNRSHFQNIDVAMSLVSELKNFKAKVEKQVENANDNRGNTRVLIDQAVESNIPNSFKLDIPIFKGQKKELIEVEVYIRAQDFACTLISPQANDIVESVRDSIIDAELAAINEIAPGILVIEK